MQKDFLKQPKNFFEDSDTNTFDNEQIGQRSKMHDDRFNNSEKNSTNYENIRKTEK